jgi:hypothetical protein
MIKPPARVQEVFKMQNSKCRMQNYRGTSAEYKYLIKTIFLKHLKKLKRSFNMFYNMVTRSFFNGL